MKLCSVMAVILMSVFLVVCMHIGTTAGESCSVYCTKRVKTSTRCGLFGWWSCITYKIVGSTCLCSYWWRNDGSCSGTCGRGTQRMITESYCGCPVVTKHVYCENNRPCPVDGTWSSWRTVSTRCSVSCGGGTKMYIKTRNCENRAFGGNDCPGLSFKKETVACNTLSCPVIPPRNPCLNSPCRNGATCVDQRDGNFSCQCLQGFAGKVCQNDVQAPVVTDCMDNFTYYVTAAKVTVAWKVPVFTDPMGSQVKVISNYPSNSSEFPWGDFIVQFVATKVSNAMQTECVFVVSIRPKPCTLLNTPRHGARVCNGWGTDYAQLCMVFCSQNTSLPLGEDHRQMWVCGATGRWIPNRPLPDCSAHPLPGIPSNDDYEGDDFTYSSCSEQHEAVRRTYVDRVRKSAFKHLCNRTNGCQPDHVTFHCNLEHTT